MADDSYIIEFLNAVYDGNGELAAALFNERTALPDATKLIAALREQLREAEDSRDRAWETTDSKRHTRLRGTIVEQRMRIDRLTDAITAPTSAAYRVAAVNARMTQPTIHTPDFAEIGEAIAQAFDVLAEIAEGENDA